jgi:biopolymer transport protein ExbD
MMKTKDDDLITEINITPLVDIILVILIIFLLVAQVIGPQVFKVKLPKAVHGETSPDRPVTVSLDTKGDMALNGYYIAEADLIRSIKKWFEINSELQVIVSADEEVHHGKVVHILDTLRGLGVSRLAIHVQQKS